MKQASQVAQWERTPHQHRRHERHPFNSWVGRENPLEKDITTHFSILAWQILWTEEPGGLQSMELQRVGHD